MFSGGGWEADKHKKMLYLSTSIWCQIVGSVSPLKKRPYLKISKRKISHHIKYLNEINDLILIDFSTVIHITAAKIATYMFFSSACDDFKDWPYVIL